ncbi:MAG: adenylate/guanylate cyclase domain-containing protein [Geminicoccaceae bacterium]|nr:adenylate/guanylate cyclase domain-containing protein [Geminicoccaceae bacterium]
MNDEAALPAVEQRPWLVRLRDLVVGPPLPEGLPERVVSIIRREQEKSEILISFAQVCIIAFFFAFYALTPKGFPPDVPFEPIPAALAFYLAFTLLRISLAFRRALTPFVLTLSVIVDIGVLMVTIWSFHLQYQLPPEMYLKAPTLMYVFIMIALRALRFEPGYVVIAGVTAAIGWMVLVAYAMVVGDESMITRSYATYVTSNSVLVGAEVDKIVSILMVSVILALGLSRSRRLLYRAAMDQQAAADLSRFFAPEVAGRIRDHEGDLRPGTAELREASIIFIDMRGFTRTTAGIAPARIMELISDYQALMVGIVHGHRGSVDKYMGDGILVSFGATRPNATHAADALSCIEDILEKGREWTAGRAAAGKPAPEIAASLASGMVMFGTVGSGERLEYTVLGEAVNLAAKLEKHCKVEGVRGIVVRRTFDMAIARGTSTRLAWRQCANATIADVADPVDLALLEEE